MKAVELTLGGLRRVPNLGLRKPRGDLITVRKSAEGKVGHAVGEASEALQGRKAEQTDRPSRKRWTKARTIGSGK